MMKLVSWNVNGIRAVLKKDFLKIAKGFQADIICLQETKAPGGPVLIGLEGYYESWNHAVKKGYSGTLILSKEKPKSVINDLGVEKHDQEGRVIAAEFEKFILVNVYVPNAKRGLERLPYRHEEWDVDFLKYLKKLEKTKPVVVCGDFNVAHTPDDLARPKGNEKTHGFTPEEREGFSNFIESGFVDTFRLFHEGNGHYTWWSLMGNCRARNVGWRIDYFLVSRALKSNVTSADILPDVMGSDHCPVTVDLKI